MRVTWAPVLCTLLALGCAKQQDTAAPEAEPAAEPAAAAAVAPQAPEPVAPAPIAEPKPPAPVKLPPVVRVVREPVPEHATARRALEVDVAVAGAAAADPAPNAVAEAVKAALPAAIQASKRAALIQAIYSLRGDGPLMMNGLNPSPGATALLAAVATLPAQDLDPADYDLPETVAPTKDAAAAAALDVQLVAGVLQYTLDFRFIYRAHPRLFTADVAQLLIDRQDDIAAATARVFDNVEAGLAAMVPGDPRYARIQLEIPKYVELAKLDSKMPQLQADWRTRTIEPGQAMPKVKLLQRRLKLQGYYEGTISGVLDKPTQAAVFKFQSEHQLDADGRPGKSTFKAMNVSMKTRLRQLRLGLHRLREYRPARDGARTYLHVNLPGFMAHLYEDGERTRTHRVIVGNNKLDYNRVKWRQGHLNRSPILKTWLYKVVLNPIWIIPGRIRDTEVTEASIRRKGYREVASKGKSFLVQNAGKGNVLGQVKFLLERSNAVYLHDTDKRYFFNKAERALSHGCMRVHEAVDFARYLVGKRVDLKGDDFDRILETNHTRSLELTEKLQVYTGYNTIELTEDGRIVFLEDIYSYDRAYFRGELPPREWTRFGSPAFKPRKVPRIPFKEYLRLKREGGPAPMKWPPDAKSKG